MLIIFILNIISLIQQSQKIGIPIGGIVGTLRELQVILKETKPNEVVVVFDGPGGSLKKRTILKNYKDERKLVLRLNRNIKNLSSLQEIENKSWQILRLIEYLNYFPVLQMIEEYVEADDLISFISQFPKYKDWNKIIVSNDQDFIQLCDHSTILYRTAQKDIKTMQNVVNEYKIHPLNFALACSFFGDHSGIKGVGSKTISKYFPFLIEPKIYSMDDVQKFCEEQIKKEKQTTKFFQNVLDNLDKIKLNYSIIQLNQPNISIQTAQKAKFILENFVPDFNLTGFRKMINEDGFTDYIFEEMYTVFRKIIKDGRGNFGT